jgi:hypothetical protein
VPRGRSTIRVIAVDGAGNRKVVKRVVTGRVTKKQKRARSHRHRTA